MFFDGEADACGADESAAQFEVPAVVGPAARATMPCSRRRFSRVSQALFSTLPGFVPDGVGARPGKSKLRFLP